MVLSSIESVFLARGLWLQGSPRVHAADIMGSCGGRWVAHIKYLTYCISIILRMMSPMTGPRPATPAWPRDVGCVNPGWPLQLQPPGYKNTPYTTALWLFKSGFSASFITQFKRIVLFGVIMLLLQYKRGHNSHFTILVNAPEEEFIDIHFWCFS